MMCKTKPTARLSDNKLVLSLPDAMTPVVWMMDTSDKNSFVLKIDQNENGLFIVQKISADGKKIEEIAYYATKKKALRAMTTLSKAMDGKGGNKKTSFWRVSFIIVATIAFVLLADYIYFSLLNNASNTVTQTAPITQQSTPQPQQPAPNSGVSNDPDAVGVPMSADDFLKEQNVLTFPF